MQTQRYVHELQGLGEMKLLHHAPRVAVYSKVFCLSMVSLKFSNVKSAVLSICLEDKVPNKSFRGKRKGCLKKVKLYSYLRVQLGKLVLNLLYSKSNKTWHQKSEFYRTWTSLTLVASYWPSLL